ncbi:Butyryl-CoA dehydrogenase [Mycolicibacterium rhodesiae JS60]|nr:Butyryl-CoA dehydrogenase [Mycolicibacterium rhodesiae JS60]
MLANPVPDAQDAERTQGIRDAVAEITKKFNRDYWVRCVQQDVQTDELNQALGDSGLLGIGVPAEFGGQDGSLLDQVTLVESLGRAGIPSFTFLIANFARQVVLHHGSPEQIKSFVGNTLTGRMQSCWAMTEAKGGTNTFAMETRAERTTDGGWKVNGQKVFISAAGESGQMLLVARTQFDRDKSSDGLSLFVVNLPTAGVSMTPMQIRATEPEKQYAVYFDDAILPDDALIGTEGKASRYLFDGLNPERILSAAMATGLGHFVLEKGAKYAREREPFGVPIGTYQAVQHPLARAFVQLQAAQLTTEAAALQFASGANAGVLANSAKLLASEAAYQAYDAAVQTHGGSAFDADNDLMSMYQLIRLLRVAPINNDMVLNYIAGKVLKLPRGY